MRGFNAVRGVWRVAASETADTGPRPEHLERKLADPEYDCLIIGAGPAGLAAGRTLAAAGQRVAVLDARDRVGGRIYTRRANAPGIAGTLPIELGAEFIHGLPDETWALVREGHLRTDELQGTHLTWVQGRLEKQDGFENAAFDVLQDLESWDAARAGLPDVSFDEYLRLARIEKSRADAAASYVEGFNAADRRIIGVAALAEQQRAEDAIQGDRLFRLREGYAVIPALLADAIAKSGSCVILNHVVERIAWSPGAVTVSGSHEGRGQFELRGRRAIITLPLGVLQAGTVDFAPEPTAFLSQAARLCMGAVVRVSLVFRSRFWSEHALSFLFTPGRTPATWWTPMPNEVPVLTGWVGGPQAAVLRHRINAGGEPDALLRECFNVLSDAFAISQSELNGLLTEWHTHDWEADAYARGAYSYVPAGALDAPRLMTAPVANTLYFAGEHTDVTGHWGTVHGALRSGMRAARQVLGSAA
jgi:monoamine oxidase